MARTILDRSLQRWEAYASTGAFGMPGRAHIVFRCASDAGQRPRAFPFQGDKSDAERVVLEATGASLVAMLEEAEPIR